MLPNVGRSIVERNKIAGYLLNSAHPDNGGKAQFFAALGFSAEHWETFANALRKLAEDTPEARCVESVHGQKYLIDGRLAGPAGMTAMVRTIWIVDRGLDTPRLVTAYPHDEGEHQ